MIHSDKESLFVQLERRIREIYERQGRPEEFTCKFADIRVSKSSPWVLDVETIVNGETVVQQVAALAFLPTAGNT